MYRQSPSSGGMGISRTSIIGYVPRSQLVVVVHSSILQPTPPLLMSAWISLGEVPKLCSHTNFSQVVKKQNDKPRDTILLFASGTESDTKSVCVCVQQLRIVMKAVITSVSLR